MVMGLKVMCLVIIYVVAKTAMQVVKQKKWQQMIRKCAAPEAELQQKVVSTGMLHQWLRRHYCTRPVAETARKLSMQKS